jgi:hypothetical protein
MNGVWYGLDKFPLPHKSSCVNGLVPTVALLGDGGAFGRWGLVEGLRPLECVLKGTKGAGIFLFLSLLFSSHEVSSYIHHVLQSSTPDAQSYGTPILVQIEPLELRAK